MNELIKVTLNENDEQVVSGRALHEYLEVGTAYKDWFPRMCEYGFADGTDFCSFLSESTGGRPATDHAIKISMAKELCMLARSAKGKEARQYFIRLEEAWNDPNMVMARALRIAERKTKEQDALIATLQTQAAADAPKVRFAENVSASEGTILIREMAKLLKQAGYDTGEKRFYERLRKDGYLIKQKGRDYNRPTQRAFELGLFEVEETLTQHSDGSPFVHFVSRVTGKGQLYFMNKYAPTTQGATQIGSLRLVTAN